MNLSHLKYAVEVAKAQSINKAAENLYMNQPNLSRAIRELEENLGISIFNRTSKGISTTPLGDEFLQYAANILHQVDEVENIYKRNKSENQKFSISVPHAYYIYAAFTEFLKNIHRTKPIEIYYKETNTENTIDNIVNSNCRLGIIRCQQIFDERFKELLYEKGLNGELICEFSCMAVLAKSSPLSCNENLDLSDLSDFIEITYSDTFDPPLSIWEIKEPEYAETVNKRVFIAEGGCQFDLLQNVPDTFMRTSPVSKNILDKYDLVQIPFKSNQHIYRDILVYENRYVLSGLDKMFIKILISFCNQSNSLKFHSALEACAE